MRKYLVNGFTQGFTIGHNTPTTELHANNAPILAKYPDIARKKINQELKLGRIAGPFNTPPFQPFHISPLSLREKKEPGKYRMIHNLSYPYDSSSINNNIPDSEKSVHYATVGDAIQILLKMPTSSYMAKTDIAEAYRLVPVSPSDYDKLGMHFEGHYYYDKCLPQGGASSCHIFELFSTAIQSTFLKLNPTAQMVHMLDDFLIMAPNKLQCQQHLDAFLKLTADIGIPMSPEKTTSPSNIITFLGIEINTTTRTAQLPQDKLDQYATSIDETLKLKKIRRNDLESLIGKLNFATAVVPAKPFLRRLYNLLHHRQTQYHYILLTPEVKEDLLMWMKFLNSYNGVTYFRALNITPNDTLPMVTDSCHKGFGGYYGTSWIQAAFPNSWSKLHISVLELYPIYVLISMFGPQLANSNILFKTDNAAVRDMINSQSSKNSFSLKILRLLVLNLVQFNINLRSCHIPGISNTLADAISRFKVDQNLLDAHNMDRNPTPIPSHLHPKNFKMM